MRNNRSYKSCGHDNNVSTQRGSETCSVVSSMARKKRETEAPTTPESDGCHHACCRDTVWALPPITQVAPKSSRASAVKIPSQQQQQQQRNNRLTKRVHKKWERRQRLSTSHSHSLVIISLRGLQRLESEEGCNAQAHALHGGFQAANSNSRPSKTNLHNHDAFRCCCCCCCWNVSYSGERKDRAPYRGGITPRPFPSRAPTLLAFLISGAHSVSKAYPGATRGGTSIGLRPPALGKGGWPNQKKGKQQDKRCHAASSGTQFMTRAHGEWERTRTTTKGQGNKTLQKLAILYPLLLRVIVRSTTFRSEKAPTTRPTKSHITFNSQSPSLWGRLLRSTTAALLPVDVPRKPATPHATAK